MSKQTWASQPNLATGRWRKISLLLPVVLLLQALALSMPGGTARAEGFSDPAFQQQWKLTDEAVATGKTSRTYFWGPQPFAHTAEVYAESPNNGQRQVQYFDKARMELTKKTGQNASLVTNGLLTVELVTGQLQVGDNQFVTRSPAVNPVAGDQVGNDKTPNYASFNQGKLAFGVPGAVKSADRTGQAVAEAVDRNGTVTTLSSAPVSLKYARYFNETGHNVADVFNKFFQSDPLGESNWLAVMGYPITEAFWARDQVVVGGKSQDVLIQLFQRRALTYTPSNPAGFQVEMGNIGQHYYVWRYGFDTRDQLPGNFRLVQPQGKSLYSTAIRKPADKVKLGDAPSTITTAWALNEGRAVVAADKKTYLADLTRARAFNELIPPTGDGLDPATLAVWRAVGSPDGRKVAITFSSGSNIVVQVYESNTLSGDNIAVNKSSKAFAFESNNPGKVAFSADSRYLAVGQNDKLHVYDGNNGQTKVYDVSGPAYWLGKTGKLLVTTRSVYTFDPVSGTSTVTPGKVTVVDAVAQTTTKLLEGPNVREALPSPDGNYFALRQTPEGVNPEGVGSSSTSLLTFRAVADPNRDLSPAFEHTSSGRNTGEAALIGWNDDGTFVQIQSFINNTAGANVTDVNFVSLVNGKSLKKVSIPGNYLSYNQLQLAGSLYTIKATHTYNGPTAPSDQLITLQNFDDSEQTVLFSAKVTPNEALNDTAIRFARVVQVPVVK
jgi:hypothetical protein